MKPKNFNIQVPVDDVKVEVTKDQKRVLKNLVVSLYDAIDGMLMFPGDADIDIEAFKSSATNRLQEIFNMVREDKENIVEFEYKGFLMVFDVKPIVNTYGYDKDEICSEIETLDEKIMDEIVCSEGAVGLPLFNSIWVSSKKGNQIKVEDRQEIKYKRFVLFD